VKYLPLQTTEYENKLTWLPLGKTCPSNDARQQRAASYKTLHIFSLLCHTHTEIVRIVFNTFVKYLLYK